MAKLLVHLGHRSREPDARGTRTAGGADRRRGGPRRAGVHRRRRRPYARPATASTVQGVGTGGFGEHWEALVSAGVPIYLSGMSSNARGLEPDAIAEGAEMAPPTTLVELAVWADSTLTY